MPAAPAARHLRLGRWGEQLAVRIYRRDGYRILARNWRGRCGEVDVIAVGPHEVVFCEVKARSSVRHGSPLEAVDRRRRDRLRRGANGWPGRAAATATEWRCASTWWASCPDGSSGSRAPSEPVCSAPAFPATLHRVGRVHRVGSGSVQRRPSQQPRCQWRRRSGAVTGTTTTWPRPAGMSRLQPGQA